MTQLEKLKSSGERMNFGDSETYLLNNKIWIISHEFSEEENELWNYGMSFVKEITKQIFNKELTDSIIRDSGTVFITYENISDDVCDLIYLNTEAKKVLPELVLKYLEKHPDIDNCDEVERVERILEDLRDDYMIALQDIYNSKKNSMKIKLEG